MTLFFLFAVSLHAAELRIDPKVCQLLTKHVPDADVTYRPGVDVQGRKVAPADLNPSPVNKAIERQFAIKLTNDTARLFGLAGAIPMLSQESVPGEPPDTIPLAQMETEIGYVTLKNGQAYLNNRPLSDPQQDELAVLCIQKKGR
ncbi:MAG: hypothetical protein HY053_09710 [Proteobacteria bacterium]|nr:hypothetical protein [Pseudomonadota bacterium]